MAYREIASKLEYDSIGEKNMAYFIKLGMPPCEDIDYEEVITDEYRAFCQAEGEKMYRKFNVDQKRMADVIMDRLKTGKGPTCFCVYGFGGTGKTFFYKGLYYMIIGAGLDVMNMASIGIAAIELPKGQTVHKTFVIDVPTYSSSISRIKPGTKAAKELLEKHVFILDEFTISSKYVFDILDKKLRELTGIDEPFGGKIVVIGGDFRQTLPIQPRANRTELLDLSITCSDLWKNFEVFKLTINERVKEESEKEWAQLVLDVN